MKIKKLAALIIGLVSIIASFVCTTIVNVPTSHETTVQFDSTYGDTEVTLKGSYYEVEDASYAVLICPGYSCDRQTLRPFANVFVKNGMSVMTFDYSGQGASKGKIGFDNAKNDKITKQIADAAVYLHTLSKISYSNIILVGHSMGGRALVRLMYDVNGTDTDTLLDSTTINYMKKISNIILLSPEINYGYSAQASLFAGTSDAEEEPWKSFDSSLTSGFNVYLFGSTADDVVTDTDILALYKHFGGTLANDSGTTDVNALGESDDDGIIWEKNDQGSKIAVGVTKGVLHSFQWYSPRFVNYINWSICSIKEVHQGNYKYSPYLILLVYGSYFFGLLGILLTLFSLNSQKSWEPDDLTLKITDTKTWMARKLLMWVFGILCAGIICCIAVVLPFGSPIMNIPYMCFIAGYGIVMAFVYAKGKIKGVEGKLPVPTYKIKTNVKNVLFGAGVTIGLLFLVWYVVRASMYRLLPGNIRIFWLFFCGLLMSIGYYVSSVENDMLDANHAKFFTKVLYNLIQYVALFLFVLFYLIIKSYSGVIQQGVNVMLMYIMVIPLGNFVKKQTGNRAYGAIVSAFSFQAFMITSAAIISLF